MDKIQTFENQSQTIFSRYVFSNTTNKIKNQNFAITDLSGANGPNGLKVPILF